MITAGALALASCSAVPPPPGNGENAARAENVVSRPVGEAEVANYTVEIFGSAEKYRMVRKLAEAGDSAALQRMANYYDRHPAYGSDPQVGKDMVRFMVIDARRNGNCTWIETLLPLYDTWKPFDVEKLISRDELRKLEQQHHCDATNPSVSDQNR